MFERERESERRGINRYMLLNVKRTSIDFIQVFPIDYNKNQYTKSKAKCVYILRNMLVFNTPVSWMSVRIRIYFKIIPEE